MRVSAGSILAFIPIILVLLSLFLPCVEVRADAVLSCEFLDPLGTEKSWSFEGRDESVPGDGVYRCPPWESNNGGWREFVADVDGDGDVDSDDTRAFLSGWNSYWTEPVGLKGDDWKVDFDGDGDMDGDDTRAFLRSWNRYWSIGARNLHGAYSWYTSGGGDYQMWRYVEEDCIPAIAGQKVTFSYWFRPESIRSCSSSPDAWTGSATPEVSSFLTSDAPADQKIVNVEDGTKFSVGDNVLIIECGPAYREENVIVGISGNQLTMENNLANIYEVCYSAEVIRLPGWYSYTGCGTVSGDSSQKVAGSYSVRHSTIVPDYYGGLVFTLPESMEVDTNVFAQLVLSLRLESSFNGHVTVVLNDYAGRAARKELSDLPRDEWNDIALNVGDAYNDSWESWEPFDWSKVKVIRFYAWFSGTGTGSFWVDRLCFAKPMPARAEIQYTYEGGSGTAYGVWVVPPGLDWYNAYVNVSLPSTTTNVKVVINSTGDFKAYIDSATFRIIDYKTESSDKGKLTLGVNVYEWHRKPGFDPDGSVSLVPSLYAEAIGDYKIISTELKVELLPNDGSSTEQDGFLNIYYCAQENNEGHEIDPAMQEEVQARTLESAELLLKIGTSFAIGYGLGIITGGAGLATTPLWLKVLVGTSASTTAGSAIHYSLQQFASDPDDDHAERGTDYFVLEHWRYPGTLINEISPFVESASGQYSLDWAFRTSSQPTPFQIRITATVTWGEIVAMLDPIGGFWIYILMNVGSTATSLTITINA